MRTDTLNFQPYKDNIWYAWDPNTDQWVIAYGVTTKTFHAKVCYPGFYRIDQALQYFIRDILSTTNS